ncbi:phospholipid-transporting ATPase ABCA3-like isoform X2 [Arctopsyche grandis]|uniref:phospholipid-transporting ATPase ABCA3-like isoform X2 n=1 Tax=Arctopsyche grandis TaxID=121162 RepID=UPI00406D715C
MSKLWILLWRKHWISRIRHFIKTLLEIFIPVLIFIGIFCFRENISDSNLGDTSYFESESVSNEYIYEYVGLKKIFYAPNKEFYNKLMTEVASKLRFSASDAVGYSNEDELMKINREEMENDINLLGVIFKGEDLEIPKRLNYSIRSSIKYKTYKNEPQSIAAEPHNQYGEIYQYFCAVQMAVDTSFIELKSKKTITKEILTQPFPYPPFLKDESQSLKFNVILTSATIASFLFVIIFNIGRIMTEKSSGIKELMKMMGTDSKYLWLAHYIDCIMINIVSVLLIVILLTVHPYALVPKTNVFLLGLLIFLYANYAILFSFVICTLFSDATLASLTAILVWIFTTIAHFGFIRKTDENMNSEYKMGHFFLLFPNISLLSSFEIIGIYEIQQTGVQFSNMFTTSTHHMTNFGTVLIFLIINCLLCIPIILIMDEINPGKYGIPKPFMYKDLLLRLSPRNLLSKTKPDSIDELPLHQTTYFENVPQDAEVGISIDYVSKVFVLKGGYKKTALKQVSFDIYRGGITVLLGHNGAGKTTLMSIITGMYPATSGRVLVNGFSTAHDKDKINRSIGLCPQHNMTFPDLTVREHIIFFAMMQGLDYKSAVEECDGVLTQIQLKDKSDELSQNLSGGGQRRMQLAIALAGNAPVLILDEPTSGLDPQNRRQLWDILLELRKNHTILLTTHFMEEADALGDRIAILDHGQLKCYGTSMYLKNSICPGYKLNILKKPNTDVSKISQEIERFYSMFQLTANNSETLEYVLGHKTSDTPLTFLASLESKKEDLGIESFELHLSTMEDVFLRICDGKEIGKEADEIVPGNGSDSNPVPDISNKSKYVERFIILKALTLKKKLYILSHLGTYLPQIILGSLLMIFSILVYSSAEKIPISYPINMNLSLYGKQYKVIYSIKNYSIDPDDHIMAQDINFSPAFPQDTAYDAVLQQGMLNISQYKDNMLVSLSFSKDKYLGLYSISVYHTLPVVINLITNIMAAEELDFDKNRDYPFITTINDPIVKDHHLKILENSVRPTSLTMLWSILTGLGWSILLTIFISYPIEEHISHARKLQLITGITPFYYWMVTLFHDFCIAMIFMCTLGFLAFDPYGMFTSDIYVPLIILQFLYILAGLSFIYAMSFIMKNSVSQYVYFMMIGLMSSCFSVITYGLVSLKQDNKFAILIERFFPTFSFDYALIKVAHIARERMLCKKSYDLGFNLNHNLTLSEDICCDKSESGECKGLPNYYTDEDFGIITEIIMLVIMFIILMIFVLSVEYQCFKIFKEYIFAKKNSRPIVNGVNSPIDGIGEQVLLAVDKVYKTYNKILPRKDVLAIHKLNLQLQRGECFGLIGVNGAGKTTTFKMLTGTTMPSNGTISIKNHCLKNNRKQYLRLLSYCPQFDAFGEYLTARESLNLFCMLRKVPKSVRKDKIFNMLELAGLEPYADIPSHQYSGGNKRKLSLAIALIGIEHVRDQDNILILLDEPTSGVDPKSRKLLHRMINEEKKSGKTIIISSHSLSECETLCDRVGILVDGTIKLTDHTQRVKKEISVGYSLTLKLKPMINISDDETDSTKRCEVKGNMKLKDDIEKSFKCELQDEHETILQYRINDSNLSYSNLFSKMEGIRERFPNVVEYYTICDPTLEDAFLAYIKKPIEV